MRRFCSLSYLVFTLLGKCEILSKFVYRQRAWLASPPHEMASRPVNDLNRSQIQINGVLVIGEMFFARVSIAPLWLALILSDVGIGPVGVDDAERLWQSRRNSGLDLLDFDLAK